MNFYSILHRKPYATLWFVAMHCVCIDRENIACMHIAVIAPDAEQNLKMKDFFFTIGKLRIFVYISKKSADKSTAVSPKSGKLLIMLFFLTLQVP